MFWHVYAISLCMTLVYMSIWYVWALYLKDNSIADIAWGTIFVMIAWLSLFYTDVVTWKQLLVTMLVTVWGARLSLHIYARHNGEDLRYAQWRQEWHNVKLRSLFQVFVLQGVIATIIAMPVIYINVSQASFGWLDLIGLSVWLCGFAFELISDWQLQQFLEQRNDPNAVMTSGLWRYSRHPNYFGESCMWWGIWITSLSLPYGWLCVISPITITYLIRYVSGIPLNEAQFAGNPEYQVYQQTTSAFIPMPPRDNAQHE